MSRLRDLDKRLVPRMADRAGAARYRLGRKQSSGAGACRPPGRLRRLDERYAGRGPLALVRDVPQLGLVVVGAVFLAGTVVVVSRESARAREQSRQQLAVASSAPTPAAPSAAPSAGPVVLGPAAGTPVADYLTSSAADLSGVGKDPASRLALVSLSSYVTPAQAVALLGSQSVRRVFLRAPVAGAEASQLPVDVTDLGSDLARVYGQTATGREAARKEYQGYVDTITASTEEEKAFQKLYSSLAKAAKLESAAYASACACVYAAVVDEPPAALQQLATTAGVRAVQVAPSGSDLRGATVVPLLPEVTTTVPEPKTPAG